MKKLFVFLIVAVSSCSSCRFVTGQRIRGNGNVRTETRSPGSFKSVSSHGSFDVFVSSGEQSVKVEAEENLLPYIETYVEGYTLHVQTKDDYWLNPGRKVKIYVSAPDYESIRSFGSGDIIGESKITNSSKLELEVSGSANIKMDVDAPEINTETNGSGDMFLKGETKSFDGEIHGSGNIKALDLRSNETKIEIFGSGNADVFVDGKLDVHVAGSGDVNYRGDAQVSSSMAGSGRVKKIE
jgi:hypothetical protein